MLSPLLFKTGYLGKSPHEATHPQVLHQCHASKGAVTPVPILGEFQLGVPVHHPRLPLCLLLVAIGVVARYSTFPPARGI